MKQIKNRVERGFSYRTYDRRRHYRHLGGCLPPGLQRLHCPSESGI